MWLARACCAGGVVDAAGSVCSSVAATLQAVALGAAVQAGIYEGEVRSLVCCACAGAVLLPCRLVAVAGAAKQAYAYLPLSRPLRPPMPLPPHQPQLQVSELMVMDVWQATLMRAFATKLAQEQGELGDADEEWPSGTSGSDDEEWEWPDEEAAAAAAQDDAAAA